jgi:thiamine biosynthesis protein ThiI
MASGWVLVKTASEISLKSDFVRQQFMHSLEQNIKAALSRKHIQHSGFYRKGGRIFFQSEQAEKAVKLLKKIFGIHAVAVAEKFSPAELPAIVQETANYAKKVLKKGNSFAVRAKVIGRHHFVSKAVEERCGDAVLSAVKGLKVNLSKPEVKISLEVFENEFFIYGFQEKCFGGLPVGVSGKTAFIPGKKLSGNFKACWLLMKRGCEIVFVGNPSGLSKKLEPWNSFHQFQTAKSIEEALRNDCVCLASSESVLSEKEFKDFEKFDEKQNALVLRPLLLLPKNYFKEAGV